MKFKATIEDVFDRGDRVFVDLVVQRGEPEYGMTVISEGGDTWRLKGAGTAPAEFADAGRVSVALEPISGSEMPEVGEAVQEYEEDASRPKVAVQ